MKTKLLFSLLSFVVITNAQGTWVKKADFPGVSRNLEVSFSIGNKAYVGMGDKPIKPGKYGTPSNYYVYNDFWEYDPAVNIWTQKANYIGGGSQFAVGFSINGKGYIGGGQTGDPMSGAILYEYSPEANVWVKKKERVNGFTSFDNPFVYKNTFYAIKVGFRQVITYDPIADKWGTKEWSKKDVDLDNKYNALHNTFVLNDKVYVFDVHKKKGIYTTSVFEFNPETLKWIQKNNFDGMPRYGITTSEKGYLIRDNDKKLSIFEYDDVSDSWKEKNNSIPFNDISTMFSVVKNIYFLSGNNLWEFTP